MSDDLTMPTTLTVMAEYGLVDPVWDRPAGAGDAVRLTALGVSDELVADLRHWNEEFARRALPDAVWPVARERLWRRRGLELAHQLQNELPDVTVYYVKEDCSRAEPVHPGY